MNTRKKAAATCSSRSLIPGYNWDTVPGRVSHNEAKTYHGHYQGADGGGYIQLSLHVVSDDGHETVLTWQSDTSGGPYMKAGTWYAAKCELLNDLRDVDGLASALSLVRRLDAALEGRDGQPEAVIELLEKWGYSEIVLDNRVSSWVLAAEVLPETYRGYSTYRVCSEGVFWALAIATSPDAAQAALALYGVSITSSDYVSEGTRRKIAAWRESGMPVTEYVAWDGVPEMPVSIETRLEEHRAHFGLS